CLSTRFGQTTDEESRLGVLSHNDSVAGCATQCGAVPRACARGHGLCVARVCDCSKIVFIRGPLTAQDSQRAASPSAGKPSSGYVREGVWHKLPGNFVHDQKDMGVTYPKKLAQGHYWLPNVLLTGATAALVYTDPKTMTYFRQTDFFQDS